MDGTGEFPVLAFGCEHLRGRFPARLPCRMAGAAAISNQASRMRSPCSSAALASHSAAKARRWARQPEGVIRLGESIMDEKACKGCGTGLHQQRRGVNEG